MGKDFEVSKIGDTVYARTLEKVNGDFVSIDLSNGEAISVVFDDVSTNFFGPVNDYHHGTLIALPDGTVDFAPKNYNPSPYPRTDLDVLIMEHPTGKLWALVDKAGVSQVFYKNDQTDGRFVFQELKNNMSASDRVIEKERKGYVVRGTATYLWKIKQIQF